jgi:hypothetical protein
MHGGEGNGKGQTIYYYGLDAESKKLLPHVDSSHLLFFSLFPSSSAQTLFKCSARRSTFAAVSYANFFYCAD